MEEAIHYDELSENDKKRYEDAFSEDDGIPEFIFLDGGADEMIIPYKKHCKLENKIILHLTLVITLLLLTACNQKMSNNESTVSENNSPYEKLSDEQLDSDTTDINDRSDYYEKYVEDRMEHMTKEEKLNHYYVNLKVNYSGRESYKEDDIIFLRNDNVYESDLYDGDEEISLPPGIYRIISEKIDGHDSNFGEVKLLTPGEDVVLTVDYHSLKAYISDSEN